MVSESDFWSLIAWSYQRVGPAAIRHSHRIYITENAVMQTVHSELYISNIIQGMLRSAKI